MSTGMVPVPMFVMRPRHAPAAVAGFLPGDFGQPVFGDDDLMEPLSGEGVEGLRIGGVATHDAEKVGLAEAPLHVFPKASVTGN